jgi:uncharacterized protein YjiS (DUF1127 family)
MILTNGYDQMNLSCVQRMTGRRIERTQSPQECLYCTAQDAGNGGASAPLPSYKSTIRSRPVIITHLIARIRSYMRYRASVRALDALNDRELADIGLSRGEIAEAALRAAR